MPAILTQLAYLRFKAGTLLAALVPRQRYRIHANTDSVFRTRVNTDTTHRVRVDA